MPQTDEQHLKFSTLSSRLEYTPCRNRRRGSMLTQDSGGQADCETGIENYPPLNSA